MSEWISVEDALPELYKHVLILTLSRENGSPWMLKMGYGLLMESVLPKGRHGPRKWYGYGSVLMENAKTDKVVLFSEGKSWSNDVWVTHWMPLPGLPEVYRDDYGEQFQADSVPVLPLQLPASAGCGEAREHPQDLH